MERIKRIVVGAVFMAVFGFIDNFFLLIGMEWFNIPDPTINGMSGNLFSDAIGVIFGFIASSWISRMLHIREDDTTFAQQFTGIIIGCAIPIGIYAIIKLI